MRTADAYAELLRFGLPVVSSEDAALRLRMKPAATSRLLGRLAAARLLLPLRRGLWSLRLDIDPLLLPEHLTRPFPAYVSLHSALYLHGVVSQIPHVVYVASLARPRRIETTLGTFSVHRLPPELLAGWQTTETGVRLATAEKALVDVLYLANARSQLFARLPEIDLAERFDIRAARKWISSIPSAGRRAMVASRLEALLGGREARA